LATGNWRRQRPNGKTKTAHQHQVVRWVREFLQFAKDKTGLKFEAVIRVVPSTRSARFLRRASLAQDLRQDLRQDKPLLNGMVRDYCLIDSVVPDAILYPTFFVA